MPLEKEKLEEKEVMQGNLYKFFFFFFNVKYAWRFTACESWHVKAIKMIISSCDNPHPPTRNMHCPQWMRNEKNGRGKDRKMSPRSSGICIVHEPKVYLHKKHYRA